MANSHRGEVAFEVGGAKAIAVLTIDGLARFSDALGNPPLGAIFRRLNDLEVRALLAFIECLTIDTDVAGIKSRLVTIEDLAAVQDAAFRTFEPFIDRSPAKNG